MHAPTEIFETTPQKWLTDGQDDARRISANINQTIQMANGNYSSDFSDRNLLHKLHGGKSKIEGKQTAL
jgi:hypothetical protein